MVTNFPFFKYNFVDYLEKTLVRPAIEIFIFHDEVWNNLQSLSATPDFKVHWVLHPFFPLLYFLMSDKSFCNLIRISFVQSRDIYTLRKQTNKQTNKNCYFNLFCFIVSLFHIQFWIQSKCPKTCSHGHSKTFGIVHCHSKEGKDNWRLTMVGENRACFEMFDRF